MTNLNKIHLFCPYCHNQWSFQYTQFAICDKCLAKAKNTNINGYYLDIYLENHAHSPTFMIYTRRLAPNTTYFLKIDYAQRWKIFLSLNIPLGIINPSNINDWETKIKKLSAFL